MADAFISALSLAAWTVGQIVPASGMGYNYLIGSGRQDHAVDHCDRVTCGWRWPSRKGICRRVDASSVVGAGNLLTVYLDDEFSFPPSARGKHFDDVYLIFDRNAAPYAIAMADDGVMVMARL